MSFSIQFKINDLPKRTNNSRGWQSRMREARKWKELVADMVILHRLKPTQPLDRAVLTLIRHSSQEPDFDGLVSGFKHVIDGLIYAGVLANDKMSNIGQPTYLWQKAPAKQGYISVKVDAA